MLQAVVLAVSVAAVGCVSHQMYRETSVVEHSDYTLVFIEFDDHGEIWSPKQFFEFQKVIRKANEHELGALVMVLAHGWNNDASSANEREGTLASYKQTLQRIADRTHAAAPGRPVVGVYLGWRGQSMRGPLKYFTFFSRQRAADRVVGTQSAAVVGQIVLETKANPASNLLLIGHSFGGLIVEGLMLKALATGTFYMEYFLNAGALPAAPDLTILLNPASPASRAKQVIDLMRWQMFQLERRAPDGRSWSAPAMISITAENDRATGMAYPTGSFFGLTTRRFREYSPDFCSPVDNQREFQTHTAGHMPVLHSHDVRIEPVAAEVPEYSAFDDGFEVAGEGVRIEVSRRRGAFNDTPYWIMKVPDEIMADHYDTWNPNLMALLNGLLTATGALEPNAEMHFVRQEGMDAVLLWPQGANSVWLVDRSRRIFGVAEPGADPELVGCVPEGIDLANVIGHDGDRDTLVIVQWSPERRDRSRRRTEIVQIGLDSGSIRDRGRIELDSDEHFLQAAFDRSRQRAFLATRDRLFVVKCSTKKAKPQVFSELRLEGLPAAMAIDVARQRLLILDDGNGAILDLGLLDPDGGPTVVDEGISLPAAMAVDPSAGHLIVVEAETRHIHRWQRSDQGLGPREVLAEHGDLRRPTFLQTTRDGSLWVGDPAANRLFLFDATGALVQVLD